MTLNRLAMLGCDLAQDYHVTRPLPADAFSVWIGQAAEAIGGDADATAAIA